MRTPDSSKTQRTPGLQGGIRLRLMARTCRGTDLYLLAPT